MYQLDAHASWKTAVDTFREEKFDTSILKNIETEINDLGNGQTWDIIGEFTNTVKGIAENRKYQHGEKLMTSDLRKINGVFATVIDAFGEKLSESDISLEKKNELMFLVADYLFAIAEFELGNPDIPAFFGNASKEKFAEVAGNMSFKATDSSYKSVNTNTQFDLQRRKSASEVKALTESYFKRSSFNPLQPLEGAEFTAEYQALKLRQEGHGRIWRFFHRKENENRMQLLADMKAELEKHIDTTKIDIDTASPADVAHYMRKQNLDKTLDKEFKNDGFAKRNNINDNKAFRHDKPTDTKRYDEELKNMKNNNDVVKLDDIEPERNIPKENKIDEAQINKGEVKIIK